MKSRISLIRLAAAFGAVLRCCLTMAAAKDIYVAQSGVGAANGADAADAYPLSWINSAANWGSGAAQVNPGDIVHLCGTFTNTFNILGSGTPASPITIHGEPGSQFVSPAWGVGSAAGIYGYGCGNIILDSLVIESTNNGTVLQSQIKGSGISLYNFTNSEVRFCTVTNIYVRTPSSTDTNKAGQNIALMGYMTNCSIHNCTVSEGWIGICGAYYSSMQMGSLAIYSNTVTRCAVGISVGDGNANSIISDVSISNNVLDQCSVWDGQDAYIHCDAMHIFAVASGSMVSNLTVSANLMGPSMGTNVSGWVFPENQIVGTLLINNNVFLCDSNSYPGDGFVFLKGPPPGNCNAMVLNNSVLCSGHGIGVYVGTVTNAIILNNVFSGVGTGIYVSTNNSIGQCDYNLYYNLGANQMYSVNKFMTLSAWQSGLSWDLHSLTQNPAFVSTTLNDLHLQSSSPAIGIGTNQSLLFTSDKDANPRPTGTNSWDLGAYIGLIAAPANLRLVK
jgi:hypothetical protein